jgi:SAM-dependent methyltransferase
MAEVTHGVRRLLSAPLVYSLLQKVTGGWEPFIETYARPRPRDRILDLGCGPADVLSALPEVNYVGLDLSPRYVEAARRRWGARVEFHCVDVSDAKIGQARFDIVLALALLHHLDDDQVRKVMQLASSVLTEAGRLVTLDCAHVRGQHPVARWLIRKDRGRNVRSPDGYRALAKESFRNVNVTVRHNLLRVPYTHAVLECSGRTSSLESRLATVRSNAARHRQQRPARGKGHPRAD